MYSVDMIMQSGSGKELKMMKETVRLIFGLPSAGGGKSFMDWYGEVDAAGSFSKEFKMSKGEFDIVILYEMIITGRDDDLINSCFFFILFNQLLFLIFLWLIFNNEVLMTEDMDRFLDIYWCQLVFNNLCEVVMKWYKSNINYVTVTMYGCFMVIVVISVIIMFMFVKCN